MSDFIGAYITGLFDKNNMCDSSSTAAAMGSSIMTDYIFWSVHVDPSGNLHYNNVDLVTDTKVVTSSADCLEAVINAGRSGSNMKRVWLSIGAGGTQDYTNINNILNAGGAPRTTMLENFQAIASYLNIAGFDYDNEDQIGNVDVIANLTAALYKQNSSYLFSFCPYGESQFSAAYWIQCLQQIYSDLGTQPVVGFNLQCYSGGAGSDPKGWVAAVAAAGENTTGVADANALIRPGLAVEGSASAPNFAPIKMPGLFEGWGSTGGWIWDTANVASHGGNPSIAEYAKAIAAGT